jgi:hypothetical protein
MSISSLRNASLAPSTTERLGVVQQEVAHLKQQGMPDAQIAAMMQTKFMDGNVPLTTLYGLLKQIQSASPPAPAPPQGDIATQAAQKVLAMKQAQQQPGLNVQQLQQSLQPPPPPQPPQGGPPQQGPMPPQGMPPQGMPPQGAAPPMPQGPHMRSGGLADLPVHNVGNEYASGGIVAFDEGGDIQNELAADQYYNKLQSPAGPGMAQGGGVHHFYEGDPVRAYNGDETLGMNGVFMPEHDEFGRTINAGIDAQGQYHNLGPMQWQPTSQFQDYFGRPQGQGPGMPLNYGSGYAQMVGLNHGVAPPDAAANAPDPFSKYLSQPSEDGGAGGGRTRFSAGRIQPAPHDMDDPKNMIVKAGDLDHEIDQIMKYNDKYGVNAGFKKVNDLLDRQEQSLTGDKQSAKKMAMAQAGFAMMRQASIRGGERGYGGQGLGGLLAAAGAGGEEYTKDTLSAMDKYRQGMNQLMGDRIKTQLGMSQNNAQMVRDGILGHRDDVRLQAQTTADAARIQAERESRASAERVAAMHDATMRDMYGQKIKPEDQIIARINQAYQHGDTAAVESGLAYLKKVRATAPGVQGAEIGAGSRENIQGMKDVSTDMNVMRAKTLIGKYRPGTAEYDQAVQNYQMAVKMAQQQDITGGGMEYGYPG